MKRTFYLLCSVALIATMTSCDTKKSEVKSFTQKFITAINEKDRLAVYDMYPACKNFVELIPEALDGTKIKVDADKKTNTYVVRINPETDQRIIVKPSLKGILQIDDSYGVLKGDSLERELALRVGVPVKELSDRKFAAIMHKDSLFWSYLEYIYNDELHGNLSKESCYWSWGREAGVYYMRIFQTIKNKGNVFVSGDNYNVEFKLSDYSRNGINTTKDVPGVDLAPGESHEFMVNAPAFYEAANKKTLHTDIIIRFKKMSKAEMILKYGTLTGEEYNNYLKELEKPVEAELPDDHEELPDED